MKKQMFFVVILAAILLSCAPSQTLTPVRNTVPIVEFARKNDFGDGYIAYVLINDVSSEAPETIIKILVTQWLEHYKAGNTADRATIEDFQLVEITLLERMKNDPSIVASVWFSIIPAQIPNDWASFPGDEVKPEDTWWRLYAPFGVYQDKDYDWLKIMVGRGT